MEDVLALLRCYVRTNLPGETPDEFQLTLRSGKRLCLPVPPDPAEPVPAVCSHSPDFRSVVWFGTTYRLSPTQAACLRLLWEAWEGGAPEVGQATLLEGAGSTGNRVRDLFRGSPIWDDGVIGQAGKGAFRLYAPDEVG